MQRHEQHGDAVEPHDIRAQQRAVAKIEATAVAIFDAGERSLVVHLYRPWRRWVDSLVGLAVDVGERRT